MFEMSVTMRVDGGSLKYMLDPDEARCRGMFNSQLDGRLPLLSGNM